MKNTCHLRADAESLTIPLASCTDASDGRKYPWSSTEILYKQKSVGRRTCLRPTPRFIRCFYISRARHPRERSPEENRKVFLWSPSHPSSPMGRRGAPRVAGLPGEGAPAAAGESPISTMGEYYIQNISLRNAK